MDEKLTCPRTFALVSDQVGQRPSMQTGPRGVCHSSLTSREHFCYSLLIRKRKPVRVEAMDLRNLLLRWKWKQKVVWPKSFLYIFSSFPLYVFKFGFTSKLLEISFLNELVSKIFSNELLLIIIIKRVSWTNPFCCCCLKSFSGNTDQYNLVSHELIPPIRARYLRIIPESWNTEIALKVELYGCGKSKNCFNNSNLKVFRSSIEKARYFGSLPTVRQ